MLDFGSLDFAYSVLATSALYHMEGERVALSVSGYGWNDISRCVRWMSAFIFAIRERSPIQIKSFHGVAPEEAHHLQNHVVDLALLERATSRLAALADHHLRDSPDRRKRREILCTLPWAPRCPLLVPPLRPILLSSPHPWTEMLGSNYWSPTALSSLFKAVLSCREQLVGAL